MTGKPVPLADRFWKFVRIGKPDECWLWAGGTKQGGYGKLGGATGRQRTMLAHRVAYELHHGMILPKGNSAVVMHTCDNPPCCNPAHLQLGTLSDNIQDAYNKGRKKHIRSPKMRMPPTFIGSGHPRAVLTEAIVTLYRARLATGKTNIRKLARETGIARSTLQNMWLRKTWEHVP